MCCTAWYWIAGQAGAIPAATNNAQQVRAVKVDMKMPLRAHAE